MSHNGLKLSASLSYYTIFSLLPLLIILIALCELFFGAVAVKGEVYGHINGLVGNTVAEQIQEMLKSQRLSNSYSYTPLISVLVLGIGASGIFGEIQSSLNAIWGIGAKTKKGWIKFLKNQLMAFLMISFLGVLLLFSLLINSVFAVLHTELSSHFPANALVAFSLLSNVFSFLLLTFLLLLIFKLLPDGHIPFRYCLLGSFFTALLFMIGKLLIGFWLGRFANASAYGAAGSVILLLGWIYYSAIILFFGAEFIRAATLFHKKDIIPRDYAILLAKWGTS